MNTKQTQAAASRFLAALALLAALVAAAVWAVVPMLSAGSASGTLLETQARRVAVAEALQRHAQAAAVPLVQLLVSPDREMRVPLYKKIDEENAAADLALSELSSMMSTPQDKLRLDKVQALRARYDELFTASVEEIELAGAQGALAQFWGKTKDASAALVQGSVSLLEQERALLAEARTASAAAEKELWLRAAAVAAAVVLAALLGGFLARGMARRSPA